MKFEDLERELPNGFHDAKIEASRWTILNGQRGSRCACWSGRPAYPFLRTGSAINVTGHIEDAKEFPALASLLVAMPKNVTHYRFFVDEWNAFIHIAAEDAQFSCAEDEPPADA